MKLLGLAPQHIFSGFENSFFDALRTRGCVVDHREIELPWLKWMCTATSFYPNRKRWATRRDLHYHTSVAAFRLKSAAAARMVAEHSAGCDAVYQVGGLWNPVSNRSRTPIVLQIDYTSMLSAKRNSEWKRRPGRHQEFWLQQENKLFRDAAVILTTTENARQSVIEDYNVDPDHVTTVGAGVSSPYDQPVEERRPRYDSKKVLFVGKGFAGKGLDTLLEAIDIVRRDVPDASLTIVGPSGLAIDRPGVVHLGRIADREAVRQLYYDHAVFAMPSRFEPLGQVFLEAMSCRLPCIGTTLDAMPEIIDHGGTGFVVAPGDTEALAGYLTMLLSDPHRSHEMGEAGFARLGERYTWNIVSENILNAMERAGVRSQKEARSE